LIGFENNGNDIHMYIYFFKSVYQLNLKISCHWVHTI